MAGAGAAGREGGGGGAWTGSGGGRPNVGARGAPSARSGGAPKDGARGTEPGATGAAGACPVGKTGGTADGDAPGAACGDEGGAGGTGTAREEDGGAGGTGGIPTFGVGAATGMAGGGTLAPGGGMEEGRLFATGANSEEENEASETARKALVEGARIGVNAGTEIRRPLRAPAGGITLSGRPDGGVGATCAPRA